MPLRRIIAINLSPHQGGAEVYTEFFVRAAVGLGYDVSLYVAPSAGFWNRGALAGCAMHSDHLASQVASEAGADTLIVNHTSLPQDWLAAFMSHPHFVSFAHHVVTARNKYAYYGASRQLLAVSQHVIDTCKAAGVTNVWPAPLWGVAYAERSDSAVAITAHPRYEWDTRKPRDRLLGWLAPRFAPATSPDFAPRDGLTLGIVSRLADLKQWPALFDLIAPKIAAIPSVHLEVFGSGIYREVRRIEKALRPLHHRVRFWGWQKNPHAIYPQLDYLLAGLPEREALGLNVIEAQMLGTPVLAVNAPPFVETVFEGITGHLYVDPREDDGRDFAGLLARLAEKKARIDLSSTSAQLALARFRMEPYSTRLQDVLTGVYQTLSS